CHHPTLRRNIAPCRMAVEYPRSGTEAEVGKRGWHRARILVGVPVLRPGRRPALAADLQQAMVRRRAWWQDQGNKSTCLHLPPAFEPCMLRRVKAEPGQVEHTASGCSWEVFHGDRHD